MKVTFITTLACINHFPIILTTILGYKFSKLLKISEMLVLVTQVRFVDIQIYLLLA